MIDVANATKLDLLIAEVLGEIKVTKLPQRKAKRSELISYRNTRQEQQTVRPYVQQTVRGHCLYIRALIVVIEIATR